MSTDILNQTNRSSLAAWTDTTGPIVWVGQGLAGTRGAIEVPFEAEEASVTADFAAITATNFNLRFYLAKRSLTIANLTLVDIAQVFRNSGATKKAYLQLYRESGAYAVVYGVFDDAGAEGFAQVALPDPWPQFIELHFGEASNGTSEDAFLALLFDGVEQDRIADFDLFDHFDFDRVTLGRLAVTGSEPTGVLHLDEVTVHVNDGAFQIGPAPILAAPPTLRASIGLPLFKLPGRTGHLYDVELSNLGVWSVRLPIAASATDTRSLHEREPLALRQLLDTSEASIWRLQVDDSTPHAPILEMVDLGTTNAQHVRHRSIWSDNGREWGLTVNSAGTLVATALSSQWPTQGQPVVAIGDGRLATFTVTDGGSISVVATPNVPTVQRDLVIRAQDDSAVWVVTVDSGLNVSAAATGDFSDTLFFDFEVHSPNGTRWRIQIDEDGTLTPWNADAFDASRYGNTVSVDSQGKLAVIDSQFKRASAHKSGWGVRTFRGGRA